MYVNVDIYFYFSTNLSQLQPNINYEHPTVEFYDLDQELFDKPDKRAG